MHRPSAPSSGSSSNPGDPSGPAGARSVADDGLIVEYEAILASTLDPFVTIDTDGIIRRVSDSIERVFGWTPGELIGRNVMVLMPEPFRSRHDGFLGAYLRTGTTNILGVTRELPGLHRDGHEVPLEISISRVDVPGEPLPLFTAILHDITERQRADRELRLVQDLTMGISQARDLRSAMAVTLERLGDATGWEYGEMWLPDADGARLVETAVRFPEDPAFDRFHAAVEGITFGPDEGLPGRAWASGRPEWIDDLERHDGFARRSAAVEAGLRAAMAVPILSGDHVVAVVAFLMRDRREQDEHLVHLVSAAVAPLGPIVQRKRAEDALAESERRIRTMLETIELVGVTLDRTGRVTFCNDHLLRLTGFAADEVLGCDWFERCIPVDERAVVRGLFLEGVEHGTIKSHFENHLLCRDGRRRLVAWNNSIASDAAGQFVSATSLGVDITDQRRNEEELQRHRRRLQELVDERTIELEATHEQLRQADRLASIGTLAAGLGHDMNNILLPVRCRLDTLDESALPEDAREHFDAMRRSVDYLQSLSDGLHLLALDPDDPEASGEATDLTAWWKQVGPLLVRTAPKHARFKLELPDGLPPLAVPPHRLTQVVLNLVVNSAEAVAAGGRIRVRAELSEDGRTVRIGVSDDGHGMTPDVKRRALDPFFTTKKRGLGTGLGLSLVHGVARSAGGTVTIESEPGEGTTVLVDIPVAETEDAAPTRRRPGGIVHVTIADERIASLVTTLLEGAGIDVRRGEAPAPGATWIAEAGALADDRAREHLADPSGWLLVLGSPEGVERSENIRVVEHPDDFVGVRNALASLLDVS